MENTLSKHEINKISNDEFVKIFMETFDKHPPLKYKYVRANESPFMTKELRKAVMPRSRLRNKLNRDNTLSAKLTYKKQRNLCTHLVRKAKRDYHSNLEPSCISDNKKFWRTVKPLFSEKVLSNENIILVEDKNEIHEDDRSISEIFSDFFSNAVKNLNIEINTGLIISDINESDPVTKAIKQ